MKEKIIVGLVVLAILLSVVSLLRPNPVQTVIERVLSGASGTEHTQREYFYDQVFVGGGRFATTTGTGAALTAQQVCDFSQLELAGANTSTISLPSSTAVMNRCLPLVGLRKTLLIFNTTGTQGLAGQLNFQAGDTSSSLAFLETNPTSTGAAGDIRNGTSTLFGRAFARVTIERVVSSSVPQLLWFWETYFR